MPAVQKLEEEITGSSTASVPPPLSKKLPSFGKLKNASPTNKKNNPNKDDPFRFSGSGVNFKCKLIGIEQVNSPRGDEMCAEAMKLAKAAVKTANAHKQKIVLNICLEGIKILDDKSGTVMHQLGVGRISFIARDPSDTRAFGLVYGSPDSKHEFYAIKTQQPATQAVLSIRDMFQIVFDMKKQQMKDAKHSDEKENEQELENTNINNPAGEPQVETLIDLQSELDHLQQGMDQLDSTTSDWASFQDDLNGSNGSSGKMPEQNNNQIDLFGSASTPDFGAPTSSPPSITTNVSDPFNTSSDAWSNSTSRPTFSLDAHSQGSAGPNALLTAAPISTRADDPFDTSHIRHQFADQTHFSSSPAFIPNRNNNNFIINGLSGSPGLGNVPETQPQPAFSAGQPAFFDNSKSLFSSASPVKCDSGIDSAMMFASSDMTSSPGVNLDMTSSPSVNLDMTSSPSVEQAFNKLVGNLDSLLPSVKNECTVRSATPDPFQHIRNPVKPSINMLRGQNDKSLHKNVHNNNFNDLDSLFGSANKDTVGLSNLPASNAINPPPTNGVSHMNPFASATNAPMIPPRPNPAPMSMSNPAPMSTLNPAPMPAFRNPQPIAVDDPFNDDFFK